MYAILALQELSRIKGSVKVDSMMAPVVETHAFTARSRIGK
jgi:hypothetical protein